MTAATRTANRVDARERSVELAQTRGETPCSWAVQTLGWLLDEQGGSLVSLALAIHSAHSDAVYAVDYDACRDDAICDCRAAQHGLGCWHRGLAIIKGRAVARLYSPAGRAEAARTYYADLAAEGNAQALGYH